MPLSKPFTMYKYFILAGFIVVTACHKTPVDTPVAHPAMNYVNFNQEMTFGQTLSVDVDSNGIQDFLFYTLPVHDAPRGKDYHQFHFTGSYVCGTPVDFSKSDFQTPALAKNAAISDSLPGKLPWFNATGVMLARKVVGGTGAAAWEGDWKDAQHHYLAIRVDRDGLHYYYGWLDVSFDIAAEKLLLHCGALCKEAGTEVKAGL